MSADYPGAIWRPSSIGHNKREGTLGIVIHWTVGREAGDITVLDGPNVDCQFYVAKDGDVYQFLDVDSQGWHALWMANHYCIGIEHEGSGEAYTAKQLEASAKLVAWLCKRYDIPVAHVDPSDHIPSTFRGIFGHGDLSMGGINVDGNNHTDNVPKGTGWNLYLRRVDHYMGDTALPGPDYAKLPYDGSLRLSLAGRKYAGWEQTIPALVWVAENGAKDPKAAISYRGEKADHAGVWRGPQDVTNVAKHLVAKYNLS